MSILLIVLQQHNYEKDTFLLCADLHSSLLVAWVFAIKRMIMMHIIRDTFNE